MSKSHALPSANVDQHHHSNTESETSTATESNDFEVTQTGLESQGAAASDMGMSGTFADMVLDCLPFLAAIPLAKRFANNPTVQAWAKTHTLEEAVDSLQGTANSLLRELWPVGVGLFAQGRAAGEIVGGVDAIGSAEITRTSVDAMSLTVSGEGLIGVSTGVAGLEIYDQFGEAGGAMAKANLKVGSGFDAKTDTDFDLVDVLRATGHLGKDLSGIISGGLEVYRDAGTIIDGMPSVPEFLNPEWAVNQELFVQGAAVARTAPLTVEHAESLTQQSDFTSGLIEKMGFLMPMASLAGSGRLTLRESSDGSTVIDGTLAAEMVAMLPALLPDLQGVLSPEVVATLSEQLAAGAAGSIQLVFSNNGLAELPELDAKLSGITLAFTGDVSGAEITDAAFISLESMSDCFNSEAEAGDLGLVGDLTRTVRLDIDAAEAEAHCPELIRQLVGISDSLMPTQTRLQLVGTASLKSDVVKALVAKHESLGASAIMGLSQQALDWAAGARTKSTHAALVEAASSEVKFSDARIVGTVCTGQGGGVDAAAMGIKGKAIINAQEGVAIDKPVSADDAARVREVLRRGHRAV